jgi:histidinol-phosphate aminotransferase
MSDAPRAATPGLGHRPAVRDDLQALEGYHSPQVAVAVRLNTNESPYAPPPEFVDAWLEELRAVPLHRYPDRAARALRDALGAHLGQPAGRIFCANGSNEVLQTMLLTYGGPGRRALVFEPTYALHSHISRITGTEVVAAERRSDFTLAPEAVAARIAEHRPDVVFLCSPNNPTGIVEGEAVIEAALAAIVGARRGLLVVDEAYGEFAPRSALGLVDDERPLVVARTYSKVWSMAALRLGFCVAPSWLVEQLEHVVLPYHLSMPTQTAGRLALAWQQEMKDRVEALVGERERLVERLTALPGLTVFPTGANFVLVRAEPRPGEAADDAGQRVWEDLLARGVLVRNFARWPRTAGCLRITVGTPEEDEAFLAALEEVLEVRSA